MHIFDLGVRCLDGSACANLYLDETYRGGLAKLILLVITELHGTSNLVPIREIMH